MPEPNQVTPTERARRLVDEAGAEGALAEALGAAGVSTLPGGAAELARFLEGPLTDALVGRIHPSTATELLERIRLEASSVAESGARMRPAALADDEVLVPTVPPPADEEAQQAYEDLASGAIHERSTPAWGIRRVSDDAVPGEALWIVVSVDRELVETALTSAPSGVEVIPASSMAVLKGALSRAKRPADAVVLDAARPSVPVDRAVSLLAAHEGPTRVLVWRMPKEERTRRAESAPPLRAWLPCDDEVTPAEIVQLLGL